MQIYKWAHLPKTQFWHTAFTLHPSPCEVKAKAVQCLQLGLAVYKHRALPAIQSFHSSSQQIIIIALVHITWKS